MSRKPGSHRTECPQPSQVFLPAPLSAHLLDAPKALGTGNGGYELHMSLMPRSRCQRHLQPPSAEEPPARGLDLRSSHVQTLGGRRGLGAVYAHQGSEVQDFLLKLSLRFLAFLVLQVSERPCRGCRLALSRPQSP